MEAKKPTREEQLAADVRRLEHDFGLKIAQVRQVASNDERNLLHEALQKSQANGRATKEKIEAERRAKQEAAAEKNKDAA